MVSVMRSSPISRNIFGLTGFLFLIAGLAGVLAPIAPVRSTSAQEVQPSLEKANVYIEVAKITERAVESWERYASWINMKTGPTGKSVHFLRHV